MAPEAFAALGIQLLLDLQIDNLEQRSHDAGADDIRHYDQEDRNENFGETLRGGGVDDSKSIVVLFLALNEPEAQSQREMSRVLT